jgi:hypothetical protein
MGPRGKKKCKTVLFGVHVCGNDDGPESGNVYVWIGRGRHEKKKISLVIDLCQWYTSREDLRASSPTDLLPPVLSLAFSYNTPTYICQYTHTHTHTLVILLPCFTRVCVTRMFVCLNFGCRPKSDVSHPNFVSCHLDTVTGVARQFHAYYSTSCPSPSDKGCSESLASQSPRHA